MCQIMVEEISIHCVRFGLSETNHNEEAVNNSPCGAVGHLNKLVVTIPTGMPLTDVEKSVLSKGLSFLPVRKTTNKYQAKADCEKYMFHIFTFIYSSYTVILRTHNMTSSQLA